MCFPVKIVGIIAFFQHEKQNAVKLANETRETLCYSPVFLSFRKS